jgi:hypothetical protein
MRRMHVTLRSSRLLIQNEKILITVGRKRDLMIRQSMLSDCLAPATQLANHVLLLLFVRVSIGNISCVCYATDKSVRPNIVLIMADDLGWTDLGCFGSGYYQTPQLDRLCSQSIKFTSAYSCGPNCAPTRACLMSGLYTPRHGVYTVSTGARGKAKFRQLIPVPNSTTLEPGYVTVADK